MNIKKSTLPNNLTVLFVETESFPSFTALLLVGAGSRYETSANNGTAHFLEHMAFKGSEQYPDSLTIASTIEGMGGVFNAFTDKDHTGYWIKAPVAQYDTVMNVLSDMLLHSRLDPEEINREKGVIIEEMNMYEDTPYRKVGDVFEELLYGGTPLGFEIIGTRKNVLSFTRDTFIEYMNAYYRPSNAVLVVAGGFRGSAFEESWMTVIEDKFGGWQDANTPLPVPYTGQQKKPAIRVRHKKTEQAHFCLGFRTFSLTDSRRYDLSVLTTILGGGMSSRLFIEVRERRGLCYYISTGREFYTDTGNLVTQAGVTNSVEKVREALDVTVAQHREIANGSFSDAELTRAKEMMKGRMLLSLENSHSIASFIGTRQLMEKKYATPAEVIEKIDAVTKESVVEVARTCFTPERMNLAVIGPFSESDFPLDYTL
ncbi:MAG: insulinase family protein [Patescibacteria group bacterium]|nr:insulinase family protein [Patescibacteria group bacterium]